MELFGTPEQVATLFSALAVAQGEFTPIARDKTVRIDGSRPYSYDYATLEAIRDATVPALSRGGIYLGFFTESEGIETTMRMVITGHGARIETVRNWRAVELVYKGRDGVEYDPPKEYPLEPKDAAALETYWQRYMQSKGLNLSTDADADDKPRAGEQGASTAPKPAAKPPAPKPTGPTQEQRTEYAAAFKELGYTPQQMADCIKRVVACAPAALDVAGADVLLVYLRGELAGRRAEAERGVS